MKISLVSCLLLGSLFLGLVNGATRYYDFVLTESNFTRLCETKTMMTVNGSFPGPEIHAHKGDTVFVNVYNRGKYGVTIHWHGVKQPRNPWSDGPENITQCPIKPGDNFTQEINLSTEEGTLWWHAHSDWSRATVHGALIIYPANGTTYPFEKPDKEITLVLASWYKGDVNENIETALATGSDPDVANSFTINGQPGDFYVCSNDSTTHFPVRYGKTYMFRVINAVLNEEVFFGIAKHNLTVVAQDAAYLKPITVPWILITPGQTMDILVTANQAPSAYYIAASPFADTMAPFDNTTTTAILEYEGNYPAPPKPLPVPDLPFYNDSEAAFNFTSLLKSLYNVSVPKNITKYIYIAVSINTLPCGGKCGGPDNESISASLNNVSFYTPKVDILEAYYFKLNDTFDWDFPLYPPNTYNFSGNVTGVSIYTKQGTRVIPINYGEEVEIVFQGTNLVASENHPMHLHGFSFYLVGRGNGNYNNMTDPKSFNLINPPEVNTIGVPKNGWAAIRFTADNPGVWFMHCHLERHSSWGMDTVLIVLEGDQANQKMNPRPAYMPPCGNVTFNRN